MALPFYAEAYATYWLGRKIRESKIDFDVRIDTNELQQGMEAIGFGLRAVGGGISELAQSLQSGLNDVASGIWLAGREVRAGLGRAGKELGTGLSDAATKLDLTGGISRALVAEYASLRKRGIALKQIRHYLDVRGSIPKDDDYLIKIRNESELIDSLLVRIRLRLNKNFRTMCFFLSEASPTTDPLILHAALLLPPPPNGFETVPFIESIEAVPLLRLEGSLLGQSRYRVQVSAELFRMSRGSEHFVGAATYRNPIYNPSPGQQVQHIPPVSFPIATAELRNELLTASLVTGTLGWANATYQSANRYFDFFYRLTSQGRRSRARIGRSEVIRCAGQSRLNVDGGKVFIIERDVEREGSTKAPQQWAVNTPMEEISPDLKMAPLLPPQRLAQGTSKALIGGNPNVWEGHFSKLHEDLKHVINFSFTPPKDFSKFLNEAAAKITGIKKNIANDKKNIEEILSRIAAQGAGKFDINIPFFVGLRRIADVRVQHYEFQGLIQAEILTEWHATDPNRSRRTSVTIKQSIVLDSFSMIPLLRPAGSCKVLDIQVFLSKPALQGIILFQLAQGFYGEVDVYFSTLGPFNNIPVSRRTKVRPSGVSGTASFGFRAELVDLASILE